MPPISDKFPAQPNREAKRILRQEDKANDDDNDDGKQKKIKKKSLNMYDSVDFIPISLAFEKIYGVNISIYYALGCLICRSQLFLLAISQSN